MNLKVIVKSLIVSLILTVAGMFCLAALHPELFKGAVAMFASVDAILLFALILIATFAGTFLGTFTGGSMQVGGGASGQDAGKSNIDRESGVVKWFNASKGFGFITRDDGTDVFVHYRSIRGEGRKTLYEGQRVRFDTSEGDKGLQADDVEVA